MASSNNPPSGETPPVLTKSESGTTRTDGTAEYQRRKREYLKRQDGGQSNTKAKALAEEAGQTAESEKPATEERLREIRTKIGQMVFPLRSDSSHESSLPAGTITNNDSNPRRGTLLENLSRPLTRILNRNRGQTATGIQEVVVPEPVQPNPIIGRDNETGREIYASQILPQANSPLVPPNSPDVPYERAVVPPPQDGGSEFGYLQQSAELAQQQAAEAAAATRAMEDAARADRLKDAQQLGFSSYHNKPGPPPSLPKNAVLYEPHRVPEPGESIHGPHVYYGSRLNPNTPSKRRNPGEFARDVLESHSQDVAMEHLIEDIRQEMAAVKEFVAEFRSQSGEIDQAKLQDYLHLYSDEMADGKYTKEDEKALRFLTFLSKSLVNPDNNYDQRSGTGQPCHPPITGTARGDLIVSYCDALANQLSPGSGIERRVWEEASRSHPNETPDEAYMKFGDQVRSQLMQGQGLGLSRERTQRVLIAARQLISQEFDQLTLSRVDLDNDVQVAIAYGLPGNTPAELQASLAKRRQNVQNADFNLGNVAQAMNLGKTSALTMPAEQVAQLSGYSVEDIKRWRRIVQRDLSLRKRIEDRSRGEIVFLQFDNQTQEQIDKLVAEIEARRDAKGKLLGRRQNYDKSNLADRQNMLDEEKKVKIDKEKSDAKAKAKSEADKSRENHLLNVTNIASNFIENGVLVSIDDQDSQHAARTIAYQGTVVRMLNNAASNNLSNEQVNFVLKQLGVTREQVNRLTEGMSLVSLEGDNLIFWQTLQRLGFGTDSRGGNGIISNMSADIPPEKRVVYQAAIERAKKVARRAKEAKDNSTTGWLFHLSEVMAFTEKSFVGQTFRTVLEIISRLGSL